MLKKSFLILILNAIKGTSDDERWGGNVNAGGNNCGHTGIAETAYRDYFFRMGNCCFMAYKDGDNEVKRRLS